MTKHKDRPRMRAVSAGPDHRYGLGDRFLLSRLWTSKISISIIFLVVTLLLSSRRSKASKRPLEYNFFQLRWTHQAQFVGLYLAAMNGYYANKGLNVTSRESGPQHDPVIPVLAGSAQFGILGADRLVTAKAEGMPVIAIAAIYRCNPVIFISMVVAGITRPQDFNGQTIRVATDLLSNLHAMKTPMWITLTQYMDVIPPSDLTQFASGNMPVWGSFLIGLAITAQNVGYELIIPFPYGYGAHFYGGSVFMTNELISENPDLVVWCLNATLKSWTHGLELHPVAEEFTKQCKPETDVDLEDKHLSVMSLLINSGEDYIGRMEQIEWDDREKIIHDQNVTLSPVDVTQIFKLQFLQEIYK